MEEGDRNMWFWLTVLPLVASGLFLLIADYFQLWVWKFMIWMNYLMLISN